MKAIAIRDAPIVDECNWSIRNKIDKAYKIGDIFEVESDDTFGFVIYNTYIESSMFVNRENFTLLDTYRDEQINKIIK